MNHFQVAIIGAGLSGCAAAKTLISKGVTNIIILEATDRVGGRVHTEPLSAYMSSPSLVEGCNIELGARWFHGSDGNILYEKMSGLRPRQVVQDFEQAWRVYGKNGKDMQHDKDFCAGLEISKQLDDDIRANWNLSGLDIDVFKQQSFNRLCEEQRLNDKQRSLARGVLRLEDGNSKAVEGYSPYDRSHLVFDSAWNDCGGQDYSLSSGMFTVFEDLFLPILRDKILLRCEAKRISLEDGGEVLVETENAAYLANHVIVTPSLGYLKLNHRQLFHPGLPAEKVLALDRLQYGRVEKVHFLFDTPPLANELGDDGFLGLNFVLCDEAIEELSNLLQPDLDSGDTWWKDATFIHLSNRHTLTLWFANEVADQVKRCSDVSMCKALSSLVKYFTGVTLPQPAKIVRTDWGGNEHFLGSYSSVYKGYSAAHSNAMLKPINHMGKMAIVFAGEAYHPSLMSTMHGAYETGVNQALKLFKNSI